MRYMTTPIAVFLAAGLSTSAVPAAAQIPVEASRSNGPISDTTYALVGQRVRVETATMDRQIGTLLAPRGDTLIVEVAETGLIRRLPIADVERFDTWGMTDRRKLISHIGLSVGLIGGWILGDAIADGRRECDDETPDAGVVVECIMGGAVFEEFGATLTTIGVASLTALAGGLAGREIGKGMKVEGWVPMDVTLFDVTAGPDGRIGLAVSVAW